MINRIFILSILLLNVCLDGYAQKKSFFNIGVTPKISLQPNTSVYNINIGLLWAGSSIQEFSFNGIDGASNINGLQVGGFISLIDKGNGVSIAGIYNKASCFNGIQVAAFNNTDIFNGIQLGGFNVSGKYGKGLQVGLGNVAKDIHSHDSEFKGVQVGLIGNETDVMYGLQLGFVNSVKRIKGLQLGVVNFSNNNDWSIGFVNIVKNGHKNIGLMYDDIGNASVTFRSGGRYFYGLIALGYNLKLLDKIYYGGGIGNRLQFTDNFFLNTEVVAGRISKVYVEFNNNKNSSSDKNHSYKTLNQYSLRLLPTFQLRNGLSLFAGPTLNYVTTRSPDNKSVIPSYYLWKDFEGNRMRQLYIGYSFGIQYSL